MKKFLVAVIMVATVGVIGVTLYFGLSRLVSLQKAAEKNAGAIGNLEEKLSRKEVKVKELKEKVDSQEIIIKDSGLVELVEEGAQVQSEDQPIPQATQAKTSSLSLQALDADTLDGMHSTGFTLAYVTGVGNTTPTTVYLNGGLQATTGSFSGNIVTSSDIIASAGTFSSPITSTVTTGVAPFTVSSTTLVSNFNADMLDGMHASQFLSLQGGTMTGDITFNSTQTFGNATIANLNELVGGGVTNLHSHPGGGGLWTDGGTYIYPSNVGTSFQISDTTGNIITSGTVTASSFSGSGSALTSLNASELSSGTVPQARLSGSYTGVTGVGTLTTGTWNADIISDAYISNTLTLTGGSIDNVAIGSLTPSSGAFTTGTFSDQVAFNYNLGAPFTVLNSTLVSNLNADLLDGSHASAFAPASGSSNYIQNQSAAQQIASFWISGTGRLDSTLTVSDGGASITGGLNNNSSGITNAGAISGATTITASGDINTTGGGYQVGGTTVINNTLNIVNVVNITASGTVSAADLSATNTISGGSVSATGTVSGGSISATGNISTSGGNLNLASSSNLYFGGVGILPMIDNSAGNLRFRVNDNTGALSFIFEDSDGIDVATIDSDGNLTNIGTITAGATTLSGNLQLNKTGTATAITQYPSYDAILQGSGWDTSLSTDVDLTGRLRVIAGSGATGAIPYRLAIMDDTPTEFVSFDLLNQRVGIGTTEPTGILHISDTVPTIVAEATGTGSAGFTKLDFWAGGRGYVTSEIRADEGGAVGRGVITFKNRNDAGALTTNMVIDGQNGNVGIGNTTPSYHLDVLDDTTGQTVSNRVANISNAGATFDTTGGALTSYGGYFSSTSTRSAGTNDLTNIGIYATASGAQNNYAAIFENGNVGIGTTNPSVELHVLDPTGGATLIVETDAAGFDPNLRLETSSNYWTFKVDQDDSDKLKLRPGASDAVTITTGGNVGIGTTGPLYVLDVKAKSSVGSATFTGTGLDDMTSGGTFTGSSALNYKVEIDGTGTPDTFKWSDDGGTTWDATGVAITGAAQDLNNGVTVTFGATTGHTLGDYWTFSTTVTNPLAIQNAAGTRSLYVGNDGNVGIGTTSPDASLDIDSGTGTGQHKVLDLVHSGTADTTNVISTTYFLNTDAQSRGALEQEVSFNNIADASRNSLVEWKTFSSGSNVTALAINGGNVGIGTSSPAMPLTVAGTIRVENTSGNVRAYPGYISGADNGLAYYYDNTNTLRILLNTAGNTYFTGGNVGIGTTNPGTKLAVAGLTGTASYSLVRVDTATGNFYYDTSSKRYKDDIQLLEDDFSKILELEPKSFIDKASGNREIGYIAEELDSLGLSNLVTCNQDGQPESIKYDKIPLYILEIIKAQQGQINSINNTLGSLPSPSSSSNTETFNSDQDLQPGEVVSVMRDEYKKIQRSDRDSDQAVVGVVTSRSNGSYDVKIAGKAQAKVSVVKGEILSGDLLTTSASTPGVLVKSDGSGGVAGVALESTSSDGEIEILVRTSYSVASLEPASSQETTGALTTSQQAILDKFAISEDGTTLIVKGDLEIQGKIIGSTSSRGKNVPVSQGRTSLAVTFSKARASGDYAVMITPSWMTNYAVTDKKETGFIVEFSEAAPSSAKIDWFVID